MVSLAVGFVAGVVAQRFFGAKLDAAVAAVVAYVKGLFSRGA